MLWETRTDQLKGMAGPEGECAEINDRVNLEYPQLLEIGIGSSCARGHEGDYVGLGVAECDPVLDRVVLVDRYQHLELCNNTPLVT